MRYVIAYDLGTSSLKASLIDENMNILSEAVEPYVTYSDADGIREQDPRDLEAAVISTTKKILLRFTDTQNIEAIGISGHSRGIASMGAAALALVGIGAWENYEKLRSVTAHKKTDIRFESYEKYQKLFDAFMCVCKAHTEIYKKVKESI